MASADRSDYHQIGPKRRLENQLVRFFDGRKTTAPFSQIIEAKIERELKLERDLRSSNLSKLRT